MSRQFRVDSHRARDLRPKSAATPADREQSPIDTLNVAARLVPARQPRSSERAKVADRLRRLAQALTRAAAAERELARLKGTR